MSSQSLPSWMSYLPLANFILTWGIAGYVYWDRRRSDAKKRIIAIEDRLKKSEDGIKTISASVKTPPHDSRWDGVEKRLSAIEAAVRNPGVCSNHGRMEENDKHINARLDGIKAGVDKIDGRLEGINRMVDLLTQNELNGGK